MKVTVVKDNKGQEEIHKTGCPDLKRRNRPYRLQDAMTLETDKLIDVYRMYWECIDAEAVAGGQYPTLEHCWYAWQAEFDVKPCASELIEMEDPDNASPKIDKQTAKQDLARRVIMAMSVVFETADGSEAFLSSEYTKAEMAQFAANWLHHLPTGKQEDGSRWWGGVTARPERSDWR